MPKTLPVFMHTTVFLIQQSWTIIVFIAKLITLHNLLQLLWQARPPHWTSHAIGICWCPGGLCAVCWGYWSEERQKLQLHSNNPTAAHSSEAREYKKVGCFSPATLLKKGSSHDTPPFSCWLQGGYTDTPSTWGSYHDTPQSRALL